MSGSAKQYINSEQGAGLFDQPLVIQGKRKRKGIETFAITHEIKRPTVEYKGGFGVKLGDIKQMERYIKRHSSEELKTFHRICLDRPGTKFEVKKNLREFTGFTFERDSIQYSRKKASLDKFTKVDLKEFLKALNVPHTGSKEGQIERILDFLLSPRDTGKSLRRRHMSSTNNKVKSSGAGRKKAKLSSSDDIGYDDETEDEVEDEEETEEEEEEEEEEGEEETEEEEEEEEEEVKEEEVEEGGGGQGGGGQVEEDIKKTKRNLKGALKVTEKCKEPDDSEIMETVKSILKEANLRTATTKSVCLQVYAKYPGVDLSKRKNYVVSCIAIVTSAL